MYLQIEELTDIYSFIIENLGLHWSDSVKKN